MAIRIIFIILSFLFIANLAIIILSLISGVNIYQEHGKLLLKVLAGFLLLILIIYVTLAIIGLL